jgi:hypothetical protein
MRFSKIFNDTIEKGEKDIEKISIIISLIIIFIVIPGYLYFYLP